MAIRLTDAKVRELEVPERGNKIHYDEDIKGFGCRVTAKGARSFVLNYRTRVGRERRITIGAFPDWRTAAARAEAGKLKMQVDRGEDPLGDIEAERNARSMVDLCNRYLEEHLPRLRPSTQRDYSAHIRNQILPLLGRSKVSEISYEDIDALHRKLTNENGPYQANRCIAVLSRMFSICIRWQWRADNPCKGVERNSEEKRHRYLSMDELRRLTEALATHPDQQAANIIRLLLLTGARRGEVISARWEDIDLDSGIWTKPGSTTKQKTLHRVPLSSAARELLEGILAAAAVTGDTRRSMSGYVFPGRGGRGHRQELKGNWKSLCLSAGLVSQEITIKNGQERVTTKPSARIHDLRHTYASILASAGLSLPIIGALLGHSQPATTARYAHLLDDPLRLATDRVGDIVGSARAAPDLERRNA